MPHLFKLMVLIACIGQTWGIRCYNCPDANYDCAHFTGVESVDCDLGSELLGENFNQCAKAGSGDVVGRSCGYNELCALPGVSCCSTDLCNSGDAITVSILSITAAISLATLVIFSYN